MPKYHGRIGFGISSETQPGVWTDVMSEYSYFGEVVQNRRLLQQGENLNKNLTVGNSISIVGDALAREHFFAIKYAEWMGVLWSVTDVIVEHPRLTLQLGEVYNGPTPAGAP